MFSFQGDYKRRAQVNLGRTKHEDRAGLLRKAQEERRAREEKRREDVAALKIQVHHYPLTHVLMIQAFWRRRRDANVAKQELRRAWDELFSGDDQSTATWIKATRTLPFFYDARVDSKRAVLLVRWLVRSEEQVKEYWYSQTPDVSWVLVRMGVMMLKSVGLSEYYPSLPC
jgi:hypothetical protein